MKKGKNLKIEANYEARLSADNITTLHCVEVIVNGEWVGDLDFYDEYDDCINFIKILNGVGER